MPNVSAAQPRAVCGAPAVAAGWRASSQCSFMLRRNSTAMPGS